MPNTVLVGAQWGDEGKGKVIDVLTAQADLVVRYQGGSNAGHTVIAEGKKRVLRLIPSGILHEGKTCVIGNGVVMNPLDLIEEIEAMRASGVEPKDRLFISTRTQMVMLYHRALDKAEEAARPSGKKIGTTGRGIGPAYAAKVSRTGLRCGDMLSDRFLDLVREQVEEANAKLRMLKQERRDEGSDIEVPGCVIRDYQLDADEIVGIYAVVKEKLSPYVIDTVPLLHRAKAEGKSILMEGAQGTMLDIDFGTYPFVTSSNPTSGGACIGTGLSPRDIDCVVGVVKAYTTRVGEGPLPTELYNAVDLQDADGKTMAERGNEFGAVTKRPRRTGWYDAVVARYAQQVNGIDYWALTKLDVMDVFPKIKICVAYELDGRRIDYMPSSADELARVKPVYEEMDGWMCETSNITRFEDLPPKARAYVDRLIELSGGKLGILSIGPARESTLRIGL
ncbi:MAG: adenylosuccinate synthase [Kiritimatiellae bacterium]|nr:adenylosuccinate synthase [Kiritimatiellia bacterium]